MRKFFILLFTQLQSFTALICVWHKSK